MKQCPVKPVYLLKYLLWPDLKELLMKIPQSHS